LRRVEPHTGVESDYVRGRASWGGPGNWGIQIGLSEGVCKSHSLTRVYEAVPKGEPRTSRGEDSNPKGWSHLGSPQGGEGEENLGESENGRKKGRLFELLISVQRGSSSK